MKKTKKILSALLAAVLMCTAATPVLAADTTEIGYTKEASFTASIPAFVQAADPGQQEVNAYTITATDVVIPDNSILSATVEYSGAVRDKNGVEIPYTLYTADGAVTSGDTILQKEAGDPSDTVQISFGASIDEKARYAGAYTDTATFTFTVAEKVYTAEEIEADEHLFAIGKTVPEYVVAEFNDDFTEVTIFANGEDSDGLMADFSSSITSTISPMQTYKSSLISATIQDGVKSIGAYAFYNCRALESAYLTDDISQAEIMCFAGCASLEIVNLPENLTATPQYMFSGCTNLKSINFPQKLNSIGMRSFQGCGFETLIIPETIQFVNSGAFRSCSNLKTVVVRSENLRGGTDTGGIFENCETLESAALIGEVTLVPLNCFKGCTSLSNVELGEKIERIGTGAFVGCTSLKNVTIPASFEKFSADSRDQVFDSNLESVTWLGTPNSTIFPKSLGITLYGGVHDHQVIFYVNENNAQAWIDEYGTPDETIDSMFRIVIL